MTEEYLKFTPLAADDDRTCRRILGRTTHYYCDKPAIYDVHSDNGDKVSTMCAECAAELASVVSGEQLEV